MRSIIQSRTSCPSETSSTTTTCIDVLRESARFVTAGAKIYSSENLEPPPLHRHLRGTDARAHDIILPLCKLTDTYLPTYQLQRNSVYVSSQTGSTKNTTTTFSLFTNKLFMFPQKKYSISRMRKSPNIFRKKTHEAKIFCTFHGTTIYKYNLIQLFSIYIRVYDVMLIFLTRT